MKWEGFDESRARRDHDLHWVHTTGIKMGKSSAFRRSLGSFEDCAACCGSSATGFGVKWVVMSKKVRSALTERTDSPLNAGSDSRELLLGPLELHVVRALKSCETSSARHVATDAEVPGETIWLCGLVLDPATEASSFLVDSGSRGSEGGSQDAQ
jgi:hypothetical protein